MLAARPPAGEWEGVVVTFDADGKAQPLPDRYVPEAYRDWGVELFDWQSQCSSTCSRPAAGGGAAAPATSPSAAAADPQHQPHHQQATRPAGRRLYHLCKRLMPTVGCEADAVAFIEEVEDVWRLGDGCVCLDGGVASSCASPGRGCGTHAHRRAYIMPDTHGRGRNRMPINMSRPAPLHSRLHPHHPMSPNPQE